MKSAAVPSFQALLGIPTAGFSTGCLQGPGVFVSEAPGPTLSSLNLSLHLQRPSLAKGHQCPRIVIAAWSSVILLSLILLEEALGLTDPDVGMRNFFVQ